MKLIGDYAPSAMKDVEIKNCFGKVSRRGVLLFVGGLYLKVHVWLAIDRY